MPLARLKQARRKTVGSKQTAKAVAKGLAEVVFIAQDAEEHVVRDIIRACEERGIQLVYVNSMDELGKACGIEVGAASAAILKTETDS